MKTDIATKIIATLGPASSSKAAIKNLAKAGVNIFRLNLSHGDFNSHAQLIKNIRAASKELNITCGIMADLPGPKIRVGRLSQEPVVLKRGDKVNLKSAAEDEGGAFIPVDFPAIHRIAEKGSSIFINDGAVKLAVKSISSRTVECRVEAGGEIGSRKGINIPGGKFAPGAITARDRECVKFALENNVDFIAMSFVRAANDVSILRRLVKRHNGHQFLIAKIEKPEAIEDFDKILKTADGIMLARGDLGIEIPVEKVPGVQKSLLAKCNAAGKPVITATQVLDSMVRNPRPTRAEAADAANAILDKTDSIMLSQETAIGKFPVEAVKTLYNIIRETEKILDMREPENGGKSPDIAGCVARSVVETAKDLNIKTIVTPTRSGHTARLIARYRPQARIVAITDSDKTKTDLILSWGVESIKMERDLDLAALIKKVQAILIKKKYGRSGEKFIITSGSPVSEAGETNVMVVETI